jgi:serine-type D-Ala-D-Ala carboxypeptidase
MKIKDLIDKRIESRVFPGIVLKVNKKDKEVFQYTMGYRQINPLKKEMRTDTFFDLASLTKPLATTTVALTIFEKEKISLSTHIGKFLTKIPLETQKITLLQLLTHSSGLPPVPEIFKLFKTENDIDIDRALEHLYSLVPEIQPGTDILYSCTGYIFLTRIIMQITGTTLSDLFRDIITIPAKIDSLLFNPSDELKKRTASTEYCEWRKRWIKGEVHDENSFCLNGEGGNSGLFGTASGIMKLLDIISSEGSLEGQQILSPSVCSDMTTCQTKTLRPKRAAGFLMQNTDTFAGDLYSKQSFGHTGFTGTSVWIDPVQDIKVVTLTNRVHFGREKTTESIKTFRKELHSLIYNEFC